MDVTRAYHISEVSPKEKLPYHITYMWNLKYDTSELIYETETDSQTYRIDLWLQGGEGGGAQRDWSLGLADASYYI